MKMIHCADLHLDSAMTAHLTGEKRTERRAELLHSFERMVRFAREQQVDAILIAGDLFDGEQVGMTAANTVLNAVLLNPDIDFYYLRGNHDGSGFVEKIAELPSNLKLFQNTWTSYKASLSGRVVITGAETGQGEPEERYHTLSLNPECINILLLHGQVSEYISRTDQELIPLSGLRNRGIDYLALGHLHQYRVEKLDDRGIFCYSGCLLGRGFDECGVHGFVMLTIDEERGKIEHEFIPFSGRSFHVLETDLTGISNTQEACERVYREYRNAGGKQEDFVKVVLTGEVDVECDLHLKLLEKQLDDMAYYVKVSDQTEWKVDIREYAYDESLKGEFVRMVMGADLLEEDREAVVRYGILALMGEEIF